MKKHYLLYGSERYALAILRPLQDAIRARGDEAAWFFDGPGGEDLVAGETWLRTTEEVRRFNPIAVVTSSNAVPHFFPGYRCAGVSSISTAPPVRRTRRRSVTSPLRWAISP